MTLFRNLFFCCMITSSVAALAHTSFSDDYMPHIEPYLGDYIGKFEKQKGTFRLAIVNNELVATFFTDAGDTDLIPGCRSTIGVLTAADVDVKKGHHRIDTVRFQFNPGSCHRQIDGREITLQFKHTGTTVHRMKTHILRRIARERDRCDLRTNSDLTTHCGSSTYYFYLTGQFEKK